MKDFLNIQITSNERIITYALIGVLLAMNLILMIAANTTYTALFNIYNEVKENNALLHDIK